MRKAPAAKTYAAVDLGSNSFHMIVASYGNHRIQIIDRIKKMIQLAAGLDASDNLSESSMRRALACLEEFGQRIRAIPQGNVRVVGTNTLRQANNGDQFIIRAQAALGHPIEIIAGLEEARLIYLGVAHSVYDDTSKRLVVDIGGGSTELIIGKGFDTQRLESHYIGCVNMSRRFFASGRITRRNMQGAILAARQEFESCEAVFRKAGWRKTIGASGTILAINSIVRNRGWSLNGITAPALTRLKEEVIRAGHINRVNLPGLSKSRAPVFTGGLAILCGLFETFDIERMDISDGALREGLLYDLIGRLHHCDIRNDTIDELARRHNVDIDQAARVRKTAIRLFRQVADNWQLDNRIDRKYLEWAACIHEIGFAVAHAQYHRHGAYLIAYSDMAGFSRQDQSRLALLVRCHRRKFPAEEISLVEKQERTKMVRLAILLRLAVLLNRSRVDGSVPKPAVSVRGNAIRMVFAKKWLGHNPLTRADLDLEQDYLRTVRYSLAFGSG